MSLISRQQQAGTAQPASGGAKGAVDDAIMLAASRLAAGCSGQTPTYEVRREDVRPVTCSCERLLIQRET